MRDKLKAIYAFLLDNRAYNKDLQEKYYTSIISCRVDIKDKVSSLLYNVANTQSQPKIDKLAQFYQFIYADIESLTSFKKFVKRVSGKENGCYANLFQGLKKCSGWGEKTSALFVKAIFHLHSGRYNDNLRLWDDAPQDIGENDRIFLPVDAVIMEIFKKIGFVRCKFTAINDEINKYYDGAAIEVWDDLWFWGFITQKGSGDQRAFGWNLNKYWSLEHSNKDVLVIKEIEEKSECFLKLLS
jgi:hypothetical protein